MTQTSNKDEERIELLDKTEDEQVKGLKNETLENKLLLLDLVIISYCASLCTSVPSSFFTRVVLKRKGTITESALIQQIHPAGLALSGWIFGKFLPKTGYKPTLIFGVILEATAQICFAFTNHIPSNIGFVAAGTFIRLCAGVGNAATNTAVLSIATHVFKENSITVVGIVEATLGVSYLSGPLIGAALYNINKSMEIPILVPGFVYLLAVLRFAFCHKSLEIILPDQKGIKISKLVLNSTVMCTIMVQFSMNGLFGYFIVILTIYLKQIGMSVIDVGLVLGVQSVCYMISAFITGWTNTNAPKLSTFMLIIGCLGQASAMFCYIGNKHHWIAYIGSVVTGTFNALAVISSFGISHRYLMRSSKELEMTAKEIGSGISGVWVTSINLGKFIFSIFAGFFIDLSAGNIVLFNEVFSIYAYALSLAAICVFGYKSLQKHCNK